MKVKPQFSEKTQCALIQIIALEWDKSARAGEMATKRNAVPTTFDVAPNHFGNMEGLILTEKQLWANSNGFVQPVRCEHHQNSLFEMQKFGCIAVGHSKDALNIIYSWNQWDVGAPRRPLTKKLLLSPNQWAQVRWNGRSSCVDLGAWWYKEVTVNIALFDGQPNGEIFTNTKPSLQFEQMASLW